MQKCKHLTLGSDRWIEMPDMPTVREHAGCVAFGETGLWVLGGQDGATKHTSTDIFTLGKWKSGPELPPDAGLQRQCVVLISGSEVLVSGGDNSSSKKVKTTYIYNIMDEEWTKMDDHINNAHINAGCALHTLSTGERKVFIIGGYGGGAKVDIFNIADKTWSTGNDLSESINHVSAFSVAGRLFYIADISSIMEWNEATDDWTTIASPVPNGYSAWSRTLPIVYNI